MQFSHSDVQVTLTSKEALKAYAPHPAHQAAAGGFIPHTSNVIAFDYEF